MQIFIIIITIIIILIIIIIIIIIIRVLIQLYHSPTTIKIPWYYYSNNIMV